MRYLALLLLLVVGCTSPLGGLNGNFAAQQDVSLGGTRGSFSIKQAEVVNQVQKPQSSIIDSEAESIVVDDSISPKFVAKETTYESPGSITTINETSPWFVILLILGWLLPSPNEILRGAYEFITFLRGSKKETPQEKP